MSAHPDHIHFFLGTVVYSQTLHRCVFSAISSDSKQDLDAQEKTLQHLCSKIKQVYSTCIGDEDATSTLVMLAALESQLERLLEMIESIPSEKVEKAEKVTFMCSCLLHEDDLTH